MNAKRIESLVWAAIYAGLILLGLGLAVRRTAGNATHLDEALMVVGLVLVAVGIGLIWWRSRMRASSG